MRLGGVRRRRPRAWCGEACCGRLGLRGVQNWFDPFDLPHAQAAVERGCATRLLEAVQFGEEAARGFGRGDHQLQTSLSTAIIKSSRVV
ncbi:hypothetical protein V5799_005335 [Amblyomma americanum]|uniref:Uncharacterized protein n=1 Tax=Amblyomma americanum TaxID=6943 RepID=A0AAQ4DZJ5_AMBAM